MIMADKIIAQRKKNGWSQEELAEKLNVSRQSVSKWEGAQSVPDLNKVIAMAELFGVTTDYLLKDELGEEEPVPAEGSAVEECGSARRVSMEESNAFLSLTQQASRQISLGVLLCILSPIPVILLVLAGKEALLPVSADQGGIIGSIVLMILIAAAVFIFVKNGMQLTKYSYLEDEIIDTEYGVTGMVKERRAEYEHTHMMGITAGVILCVLSSVPIIGASLISSNMLSGAGACAALILIAAGVWMIVKVSIIWEGFQKLLEEGDYSRQRKSRKKGVIAGIYWCTVTAIFLAYSFWTADWGRSWIIWPVAGLLFFVVVQIEDAVLNRK